MDLATAIKHAIDGNAVLFLGSGFSVGAKPIKGDAFLTGRQLSVHLSNECGISPPNEELNYSSQRYRKKYSDSKLVGELQSLFSVSSVSDHHRKFPDIPWKSIYTTNYDNVLERAYADKKCKLHSITPNMDSKEYTAKSSVVIHINGYIETITTESLSGTFKWVYVKYRG